MKGVFYEKNCPTAFDDLNHEVALVGYDKDYYILRNQWVNTMFWYYKIKNIYS